MRENYVEAYCTRFAETNTPHQRGHSALIGPGARLRIWERPMGGFLRSASPFRCEYESLIACTTSPRRKNASSRRLFLTVAAQYCH